MPSKSIIESPDYLKFLNFIVDKKTFSSSDFINNFLATESPSKHKYNKIQNLSKKLQYLKKEGLIISLHDKPQPNKIKGSNGGRSGHYQDNTFEFFLKNYLFSNYYFNLTSKHKKIVEGLFYKNLKKILAYISLPLKQVKSSTLYKVFGDYLLPKDIDTLFMNLAGYISDILIYRGLNSNSRKDPLYNMATKS